MKRLLKSFTGIVLSALLAAAMAVIPAFAETTETYSEPFDAGTDVSTIAVLEGRSGEIVADPQNPDNYTFRSGGDLAVTDNYINAYLRSNGTEEVSFDVYIDSAADRSYNVKVAGTGSGWMSSAYNQICVDSDGTIRSGGNGVGYTVIKQAELNTWHNIKYVFEKKTEGVRIYEFVDGALVADSGMMTAITEFHLVHIPNYTYYDNVKVVKYDAAPSVSLSGGAAAPDTLTAENLFTKVTATLADCPMATSVVFKNNGDVIATAPVGADGTASASVTSGEITAHVMCGANVIAVSDAVTVEGVSGTQSKYFSMDFTNVVNYADCYTDGQTNWGNYNYYVHNNRDGFGTSNTSHMQLNTDRTTGANGVDLKDGAHGEAVLLTGESGTVGDNTFGVWARSDNPGIYYGLSQEEYNAAPGASYSEKMAAQYIVMQSSYRFPDFNAEKHLMIPFFTNASGARISWGGQGYAKVEASAGANTSKMVMCGNGAEITAVQTDTWYTVTNVIDLKNATSYLFVDGEMKVKYDFSSAENMSTLINIYEIVNYQLKPDSGRSEMYIDDFSVYALSFANDIADPAADGSITIQNDGSARDMSIITAIYTDSACKRLDNVVITPADFAAGELQKKVTPDVTPASGQTAKTIYVNNLTDIKPLRAAK